MFEGKDFGFTPLFFINFIMEKHWYVYLLECEDNSLYTGITNDLDKRMKAHASNTGSKYVSSRGFKKLLFTKKCENKSGALKLEYKIKKLSKKDKILFFK